MAQPKFVKSKMDWGDRIYLPNLAECIEDKRAKGGKIEIWRGAKMLLTFEDMRAAKKAMRGFLKF